jgi:phosphoglycolate phosphatase
MHGWLHRFPLDKVVELSQHQRKPDPKVLLEICRREDIPPLDAAYVGDSMARDVLAAIGANVLSIWAKYGAFHDEEAYRKLIRISHWTAEDIARERALTIRAKGVRADYILERNFCEILNVFDLPAPSLALQR